MTTKIYSPTRAEVLISGLAAPIIEAAHRLTGRTSSIIYERMKQSRLKPTALHNPPPTADNDDCHSSGEDSTKLIWQDDSGIDLRSLFAKDMLTMTQQIDGCYSDDDSDDNDDRGNGTIDGQVSLCKNSDSNQSNIDKVSVVDGSTLQKENENTAHQLQSKKCIESIQNLTPPPNASTSSRATHSAETPATISKLKRKRHNYRGNVPFYQARSQNPHPYESISESTALYDNKQKISASQEVDRVFDYLGLPDIESGRGINSKQNDTQDEGQDHNPIQSIHQRSPQLMDYFINSGINKALGTNDPTTAMSPIKERKLFHSSYRGDISCEGKTEDCNHGQSHEPDRRKFKLPPLVPVNNVKADIGLVKDAEDENEEFDEFIDQKKDGMIEEDTEDLFNEIEQDLDRVTKPSLVDHPTNDTSTNMNGHQDNPANVQLHNGSRNQPTSTMTLGAMMSDIHPSNIEKSIRMNNYETGNISKPTAQSITCVYKKRDGADSEFGNDDWNDEDLAALDLSVAASQSKTLSKNITSSTSDPVNNITDEFGDEWNDEDLAGIDLSVALTYSNNNVPNTSQLISKNSATQSKTTEESRSSLTCSNIISVENNEFSDDDFAGIDFDDIDSKVAEHQTRHVHSQAGVPSVNLRPPRIVPTHNRRIDATSVKKCSNDQLSYLAFTRYVIRSVDEDGVSGTKTLGVDLWTKHEAKRENDFEYPRNACLKSGNVGSVDTTRSIIGYMHLRGVWFYTKCFSGDIIHLCSIGGQYLTDPSALPVVLDSVDALNASGHCDDLVLVIHPDILITPTLVSEAVHCPRLAVLQSRLGSTGLSSKSAVIGTLRHDLFERCLQEHDASRKSAAKFTRDIIRNRAEMLLGCGITDQREAFGEVMKTITQVQTFLQTYTSWNASKTGQLKLTTNIDTPTVLLKGDFDSSDTLFSIRKVYSTEEWAMCPELGLKGFIDATIVSQTKPRTPSVANPTVHRALMPLELKTGYSQSVQPKHCAQLSVYSMMLRSRYGTSSESNTQGNSADSHADDTMGSTESGVLLYLNHESFNAVHIKPNLADMKHLIGQRNDVACDVLRAGRPRGITIQYKEDGNINDEVSYKIDSPPPSNLPLLNPNVHDCERCYKSRECMMYAIADLPPSDPQTASASIDPRTSHRRLAEHFTSQLSGADLEYFRKWDRLIDLERDANMNYTAKYWLANSIEKEQADGRSISSLVLDETTFTAMGCNGTMDSQGDERVTLRFARSSESVSRTPLVGLSFECGNYVTLSTDGTSFTPSHNSRHWHDDKGHIPHKMHILRGFVGQVREGDIDVKVSKKHIHLVRLLLVKSRSNQLLFRLDIDDAANGAGLLLQNLINFLTLDIPSFSTESLGQTPVKTKAMTCNTEYSERRRRLQSCITQLSPTPRFSLQFSLFQEDSFIFNAPGCDFTTLKQDFLNLNHDQKRAVTKVISAEDFVLIQGLPGTGKSATISFITRLLVARGKRVLLTSYTHSAVDNLLCKLLDSGCGLCSESSSNGDSSSIMLRIGAESSCHQRVHSILAQNLSSVAESTSLKNISEPVKTPNVDFLHKIVSSAKIIGVTALTAPKSPLLSGQYFDFVIIDEAGQISQPCILGAVTAAERFVLVGDHMQLPPLVRSEIAQQAGYGVSMLMHLAEAFPDAVAKLTIQYRMHEDIQLLSNIIAYNGLLKCANDNVKRGVLRLQKIPLSSTAAIHPIVEPWVEHAIAPSHPVVFLDTDGLRRNWHDPKCSIFKGLESDVVRGAVGPINEVEVAIVETLIAGFFAAGLDMSSLGVITPLRSQLRMLNDTLGIREYIDRGLEVCTIDRFQGRDKPAIIYSSVRSNGEGKAGRLLQDFRRLNVAFSRAKQKFIMVGSFSTLHKGSDVIRPVLDSMVERKCVYKLTSLACMNC